MHDWVLWVLVVASALHVMEEHALGWQGWANQTLGPKLGLHPTWADFWATDAALIVLGLGTASVGWRAPAFALALPALCLINAVFFHLLPSWSARRPNPGLITALALYIPIGGWSYLAAADDQVLTLATAGARVAIGAVAMATAIWLLALMQRFGYPDTTT